MENRNIKDILLDFIKHPKKTKGLLLLTLPTGFGKTYYALLCIAELIKSGFKNRIWFITNLKKNLPYEELRKLIGDKLYKKHVVFINGYSEQVKSFFTQGKEVSVELKTKLSTYEALKKAANQAISYKASDLQYKDFLQKRLMDVEAQFRKELKMTLKGYFPSDTSNEQKLKILRSKRELRWIEDMYPSVQFFEKTVFFCSIDKFYRYIDTIIGPNIQLRTPAYLKDNIIFIDEFDATKANIKNAIIDNAIQFNRDIISLFTAIYYGLTARNIPENRLAKAKKGNIIYLTKQYQKLLQTGQEIYDNYHLKFHYFFPGGEDIKRFFLFHDYEYHIVIDGQRGKKKERFITRVYNDYSKTNVIDLSKEKPTTSTNNLVHIINDLRGFIHLYSFFTYDLARIYKEVHDQENQEEISIENAVRTILDWFDIKESNLQVYFIDYIFQQVYVTQSVRSTQFDFSPTNKGFRFYDIVNRKQHDATTRILYADTLTTPETWLLNLCQYAKVIGVSATAGFDSPISNYSLSQLKYHLKENFHQLSPVDMAILEKEVQLKNLHSKKRTIKCHPISIINSPKKQLGQFFKLKEIVNKFLDEFSELQEYEIQRYLRTLTVYKYFLEHQDIYSILCLLNKFPRKNDIDSFREDILIELFVELRMDLLQEQEEEAKAKVAHEVHILRGQNFEEDLANINSNLESGDRAFVISTYQTIGAGQNIQYKKPENSSVVSINDLNYGEDKKDYDAIYLEKPTYLLQYFKEGSQIKDKDLFNYLFELEYLTEGGAINLKEKNERIKYGFKRRHNPKAIAPSNAFIVTRKTVVLHFCRILLQAVGRLSRTKYKNHCTHILYDAKIKDYLQYFKKEDFLLVKEFEALLDDCLTDNSSPLHEHSEIENLNNLYTLSTATLIRRLVRKIPNWNKDTIKFWSDLRRFVLKHPTLSEEDMEKSGVQKLYLRTLNNQKVGGYHFHSEDDFLRHIQIDFNKKIGKEVSAKGAFLPELLEISSINKLFEENNFAKTFKLNPYILSPPLFQNIYLGALGEEIGKHLLSMYGFKLLELEESEYELFDFKMEGQIYIDFKFWGHRTFVEADGLKEEILRKKERVNAQKVLIINIIQHNSDFQPIVDKNNIIEIPGLISLEQNRVLTENMQFIHQTTFNNA